MRKGKMKNEWKEEDIRQFLRDSAGEETIPESLHPDKMKEWLQQQTEKEEFVGDQENETKGTPTRKRVKYIVWWSSIFVEAACVIMVLFAVARNMGAGDTFRTGDSLEMADEVAEDAAADEAMDAVGTEEGEFQEGTTYAKLYQSFDKYWQAQEELYRMEVAESAEVADAVWDDAAADDAAADDAAADETLDAAADDTSYSAGETENVHYDKGGDDSYMSDDAVTGGESGQKEEGTEDYGKTNQQEESVEEADIIKNDGRYLYRVVERLESNMDYSVRIVDTKDGLKEASMVGNFEIVQNIYVWEDKLVVMENKWAMGSDEEAEGQSEVGKVDDMVWGSGYPYCRIHVYDISDRTAPKEYHTFTVKGSYLDSRISDGYLYYFALCDTSKPKTADDLEAYIPMMDGKPMPEDKIMLPDGSNTASYLVMASVDMAHPDTFADTQALVASADKLYVSQENIYLADTQYASYNKEGEQSDSTTIYRFSYKDGQMRKEAMGKVKGTLRDDMAMNEYRGHLRMVTTVQSQVITKVIDDISEQFLGYDESSSKMTNSLYVLDSNLKTVGKIEDLAPDERIYSARFMGDSGYFVTFRETDPLFSVDLSDPKEPKVLGELKISGFSEYLHFYEDNLLLGIGMEADEKTGATECMKLSMFDISDPKDVKEQSKLLLSNFEYSEALYNYKAVLIDTKKNLFGFCADDYFADDSKTVYMLFTFKDDAFAKVMEIDCSDYERYGYEVRGTYIGERFFLFLESGLVEEYSLTDGSKVATLEP